MTLFLALLVFYSISCPVIFSLPDLAPYQEPTLEQSVVDPVTCSGPWLRHANSTCLCGTSISGAVFCDNHTGEVRVIECYCMTLDSGTGQMVAGACFYTCANGSRFDGCFAEVPTNCSSLKRTGTLCGDCDRENHAFPRAYSYDTDCIRCLHADSWWQYLAVALVPLTVFIVVVLVCRISVVSPQLRAFVFLSQVVSTPINVRSFILSVKHKSSSIDTFIRIYMTIFGVWNLDFFRTLYPGVCLHLTELQVLALDYLVALYPMVLMILAYVLVELHGYGFRPLLVLWRPFHYVFARFRREWNIQTTIIDAFVTFFILSTTKFFSVSFDLLIPTELYLPSGYSPDHGLRLYYNANILFMGRQHLPYAILALASFCLFVLLPFFLLMASSSPCLKRRNCDWRVRVLREFLYCFQQYYKDGSNGSPDRRWYSSLYIVVYFTIYLSYTLFKGFMYYVSVIMFTLFAIVVLVVEPYKQEYSIYNCSDCVMFLWLALFCVTLDMLNVAKQLQTSFCVPSYLFFVLVSAVPLVYVGAISLCWMLKRATNKCCCIIEVRTLEESVPHRIACSSEYRD